MRIDGSCSRYRWSRPKTRTASGAAWGPLRASRERDQQTRAVLLGNAWDLADLVGQLGRSVVLRYSP